MRFVRSPARRTVCFALFLLVFLAALAVAATEQEESSRSAQQRIKAEPQHLTRLLRDPRVKKMLKELPADHNIQPEIRYSWSDDEHKRVPKIVALYALGPKGKRDGPSYLFGAGKRVIPYKNGQKDGVERRYRTVRGKSSEERLVAEIPWNKGKIDGLKKLYHRANGKLWMKVPFEKGEREGKAEVYDLPGRLQKVIPYKNDEMHGKVIEYYPEKGKKRKVIPFVHGKVEGEICEYFADGKLKRKLPAKDGLFHGVEKQYDEKGELVRTRYWWKDEPVSLEKYQEKLKGKGKKDKDLRKD